MESRIPINNTKGAFVRNEKDSAMLLIPKGCSYNEALTINRIGREILELIDGERTVSDITTILSKRYRQVPVVTIRNDVRSYLNNLFKLNLIKYKEDAGVYNGEDISTFNEFKIHHCGEGNFKRIRDLLTAKDIYLNYLNSTITEENYDPLTLRAKLFNFLEEFYILEQSGKDVALFSVLTGRHLINKMGTFGRLMALIHINADTLSKFINTSIEHFKQRVQKDCSRIRLSWVGNSDCIEGEMSTIIKKSGFEPIAILKDEYGLGKNQLLYDRLVG